MECEKIKRILKIHPDDRTEEERLLLSEHLKLCKDCRRLEEEYSRLDGKVKDVLLDIANDVDSEIERRILINDLNFYGSGSNYSYKTKSGYWLYAVAALFIISTSVLGYMAGYLRSENIYLKRLLKEQRTKYSKSQKEIIYYQGKIAQLEGKMAQTPRTVVYNLFNRKERKTKPYKTTEGLLFYRLKNVYKEVNYEDMF